MGKNNFGGGGGTGVSVSPVGFLIVSADGKVELLSIHNPTNTSDLGASIENIVDKAPDIISKIKAAFGSKKKKKEDAESEAEDAAEETSDSDGTPDEPVPEEEK